MKTLPARPANIPEPPKGYVYLGSASKIKSPADFVNNKTDYAYFSEHPYGSVVWNETNYSWFTPEPWHHIAAKPNTPLYNLNKDLLPMNAPATTVKTLKYKIVTRQNGLVAVQITEQSHRNKEFGESAFYFGKLRSDGSPEVTASTFYVRGMGSSADDKPMLFTDSQFEEFEKEVAAYNSHFSKPAILKVVFFEYSAGSVRGYRRVEVVKEDSTYLEGIDSKKGEYRKFLKSKIIGPVDTVKA